MAAPLCVAGIGCVNLDPPREVTTCKSTGTCSNGGVDAGGAVDSALPDVSVFVDVKPSPDTAVAADARLDSVDATKGAADAIPDTKIADVASDSPVVAGDAQVSADTGGAGGKLDAEIPPPADALAMDSMALDAPAIVPDASSDVTSSVDARIADTAAPADAPTAPTDAGALTVKFANGRGVGVMAGYGWVTLGTADVVSSPTCGTPAVAITSAAPCLANTNWITTDALCMTGYIPQLSATTPDYAGNWGLQVGVNAKEPNSGVGTVYANVTINVVGAPLTGLRATIHRSGDGANDNYCYLLKPGQPMPLTDFNTKCWDNTGTYFTEADAPKLDKVGVLVPSTTAANIAVTNLCITSMAFGK